MWSGVIAAVSRDQIFGFYLPHLRQQIVGDFPVHFIPGILAWPTSSDAAYSQPATIDGKRLRRNVNLRSNFLIAEKFETAKPFLEIKKFSLSKVGLRLAQFGADLPYSFTGQSSGSGQRNIRLTPVQFLVINDGPFHTRRPIVGRKEIVVHRTIGLSALVAKIPGR